MKAHELGDGTRCESWSMGEGRCEKKKPSLMILQVLNSSLALRKGKGERRGAKGRRESLERRGYDVGCEHRNLSVPETAVKLLSSFLCGFLSCFLGEPCCRRKWIDAASSRPLLFVCCYSCLVLLFFFLFFRHISTPFLLFFFLLFLLTVVARDRGRDSKRIFTLDRFGF